MSKKIKRPTYSQPVFRRRSLGSTVRSGNGKPGRPRTSTDPKSTTNAGYGVQHQRLRARWAPLVARGGVNCALCGERILPGAPWHLAHADHPLAHRLGWYDGPSHAACNSGTNRRQRGQTNETKPPAKALAWFDTP